MPNTSPLLEPDSTYHIYNRANGSEKLFLSNENYRFFFTKYRQYIEPITDTFCYCLMPNHFHFLIRILPQGDIEKLVDGRRLSKTLQGFGTLEGLKKQKAISLFLSRQFSHLFNGYTQAFNKQQNRRGNLFMHNFKRKKITDEKYLRKLVHYIHYNPVAAGMVRKPEQWKHSSYASLISDSQIWPERNEIFGWFGDRENFIHCHQHAPELTGIE